MTLQLQDVTAKIDDIHNTDVQAQTSRVNQLESDIQSQLNTLSSSLTTLSNSAVKLSGNQTISGTKTFANITTTNRQVFNLTSSPVDTGAIKPVITVQYRDATQPDTVASYNNNIVSVVGSAETVDNYNGTVMFCSPNGTLILGAGESSQTMPGALAAYDTENIYMVADANINMYTGCANDGTSYKLALSLASNGNATFCGNVVPNNGAGATIKQKYVSGTTWYRIYTDGWIEQGGYFNCSANGTKVTFSKAFTNTNYYLNGNGSQTTAGARFVSFYNRTTTGAACYTGDDSSFNAGYVYWYACGY